MSAQHPKMQIARLLQTPAKRHKSSEQFIVALRRMSMPLPRDPSIDPEFYALAEVFRKSLGPKFAEIAAELEARSQQRRGQDD